MRVEDEVEVQTVKGHADDRAATGWRYAGEKYLTTAGVARRRERAGLVEIQGEAPTEGAEVKEMESATETEAVEDSEPATEIEQDEDDDSEGDTAPDELEEDEDDGE